MTDKVELVVSKFFINKSNTVYQAKGNYSPITNKTGNLFIFKTIKNDDQYSVFDHFSIIKRERIKFSDIVTKKEVFVTDLHGESHNIHVSQLVKSKNEVELLGKGLENGSGERGDLLINFEYI